MGMDVRKREQQGGGSKLWDALAQELRKRLKRPGARVGLWWKGCRFLPPFHRTETLSVKSLSEATALSL